MRYLRDLKMPYPSHSFILEEIIQQIGELQERIARIEHQMELQCAGWSRKPLVDAIMALRTFKIIASMTVVTGMVAMVIQEA